MVRWVEPRGAEEGLGQFGSGVSALVRLWSLRVNGASALLVRELRRSSPTLAIAPA